MDALQQCEYICKKKGKILDSKSKSGLLLFCPEYSKSVKTLNHMTEKTFSKDNIFSVIWFIKNYKLHASLCPSLKPSHTIIDINEKCKTQLHNHNYLELIYIIKGTFTQNILGETVTFNEGDLCLIDTNSFHQEILKGNTDSAIIFFGMPKSILNTFYENNVLSEELVSFFKLSQISQAGIFQYIHFAPGNNSVSRNNTILKVNHCINFILAEFSNYNVGSNYICQGILTRIFDIISNCYEAKVIQEIKSKKNHILYNDISNYIKENFATVTLKELSEIYHYQEDFFNRLIKKSTGQTYSHFVLSLKIDESKKLLKTTNKTITEIAEICGFKNKGFFYDKFKKATGLTPAAFRNS